MSTNAYWRPVVPKEGNDLSDEIKRKIARRYMDHDGSLSGSVKLGKSALGWLEGLRDSDIEDADKLIEAIEKHYEIEVWLEC